MCEHKNPYPVGPGWWLLLDDMIPTFYEIDPDLIAVDVKEKYGVCTVWVNHSEAAKNAVDSLSEFEACIESQSATICENCGKDTGVKPAPETPYCARCFYLSASERFAIREETAKRYFRYKQENGEQHKATPIEDSPQTTVFDKIKAGLEEAIAYEQAVQTGDCDYRTTASEDEADLRAYEEAVAEYRKNPVSSPVEELWKELGLDKDDTDCEAPTPAEAVIEFTVDADLYKQASEVLGKQGLTVEDAVRMLFEYTAVTGTIPPTLLDACLEEMRSCSKPSSD